MKKLISIFLICLISAMFVSCSENETIGIRGKIKEIKSNNTSSFTLYVEGEKEDDTEYDKASVYVSDNTSIYDGRKEIHIKDLEEGLMVEIVFENGVAESYPVQAEAKKIYILDE